MRCHIDKTKVIKIENCSDRQQDDGQAERRADSQV